MFTAKRAAQKRCGSHDFRKWLFDVCNADNELFDPFGIWSPA
jgi:hypothetical protein